MRFESLPLPRPPVFQSSGKAGPRHPGGLMAVVAGAGEIPGLPERAGPFLDPDRLARLEMLLDEGAFTGSPKDSILVHARKGGRLLLQGAGTGSESLSEAWRCAGAALARHCRGEARVAVLCAAGGEHGAGRLEALLSGLGLSLYDFTARKASLSGGAPKPLRVQAIAPQLDPDVAADACRAASALLRGVYAARNVANAPPNLLPPLVFAGLAKKWGEQAGLRVRVHREARLKALGMGLLLAVAQGSAQRPALIEMVHGKRVRGRPAVLLVGKGVTFDTGGISLKRPDGMDKMRYDMCGGAAVLGAMIAIAQMKLPLHVTGLVPAVENMPGGKACRPGDVLRSMSGLTVEILNTDAEGRLILADALSYGRRMKPDLIVDLATLTGAVRGALGSHMAAMLGTAPEAMALLGECGRETHERVWPLPLDEDYDEMIRGGAADLKNLGGPFAGTITAAQFLKHFAGEHRWIHVDIAGVAYDDPKRPYAKGKGASGFGVRLLARFLGEIAARGAAG